MPTSGSSKPGDPGPADPRTGAKAFDGEEPTEVMPPKGAAAPRAPEPEPENRDKQYVAPTAIPVARVPDRELEGAKIVLNIPEPSKDVGPRGTGVAEQRARRRAPTVKIARGALGADGGPHRASESTADLQPHPIPAGAGGRSARSDELTTPDNAAIRIPIDVTVDDPDLLRELGVVPARSDDVPSASPSGSGGRITPVKPISASPPPMSALDTPPPFTHVRSTSSPPRASRPNEPLAQSIPVTASMPRERSRLPWIALALLTFAGIGAAIFVVANRPAADGADAPSPQAAKGQPSAASTALAATTSTVTASAPAATIAQVETPTADARTSSAPASAAKPSSAPLAPSSVVAVGPAPHPINAGSPAPALTTAAPPLRPTARPPVATGTPTSKPPIKPSISAVPVGI